MGGKVNELAGRVFGRLTVLERARRPNGAAGWLCRCSCGNTHVALSELLKSGATVSCGCRKLETAHENGLLRRKHGMRHTQIYRTWSRMKERCLYPKHKSYKDYGGRGIAVCERWLRFENFYADMGVLPAGHSIERINNNGHYEPGNCRWAPMHEQYWNRRDSLFLTAFGETKPAIRWLPDPRCNASRDALYKRIEDGWSHEDAIGRPMKKDKRRRAGLIQDSGKRRRTSRNRIAVVWVAV